MVGVTLLSVSLSFDLLLDLLLREPFLVGELVKSEFFLRKVSRLLSWGALIVEVLTIK